MLDCIHSIKKSRTFEMLDNNVVIKVRRLGLNKQPRKQIADYSSKSLSKVYENLRKTNLLMCLGMYRFVVCR